MIYIIEITDNQILESVVEEVSIEEVDPEADPVELLQEEEGV